MLETKPREQFIPYNQQNQHAFPDVWLDHNSPNARLLQGLASTTYSLHFTSSRDPHLPFNLPGRILSSGNLRTSALVVWDIACFSTSSPYTVMMIHKQIFFLLAASMPSILTAKSVAPRTDSTLKLAVGGYSDKITTLGFDPLTKKFTNLSVTAPGATGHAPTFFSFSPDGQFVYSANHVSEFEGKAGTGSVTSFRLAADGSMTKIATALTSADPVSLMVSPDGKNLIVASFTAGAWTRHSLDNKGGFVSPNPTQTMKYNGHGPNATFQAHSFLHHAVYDPTGRLAFFVDLGGDSVYVHTVDKTTGALSSRPAHVIKLAPGSGPRHLSMVPTASGGYDIYVICQISNQIVTVTLTDKGGSLTSTIRQTLSSLPAGVTNANSFAGGEVGITRDGRFVYATNRQMDFKRPITDNSLVRFTRNPKDGTLTTPAFFPITVGGKTPRHFSFSNDRDQSLLLVGCQESGMLLVYQRQPNDGSIKLLSSFAIKSPLIQLFLPETKKVGSV